MLIRLVLLINLFLNFNFALAENLEYQEIRTERIYAPKNKRYPLLEELEDLLYPQKDFKEDNPKKRLERLELACFGEIQSGSITSRLNGLKDELENWQIAHSEPRKVEKQKIPKSDFYQARQRYPSRSFQPKRFDYEKANYRMVSPMIQTIGRKSIDVLFKGPLKNAR